MEDSHKEDTWVDVDNETRLFRPVQWTQFDNVDKNTVCLVASSAGSAVSQTCTGHQRAKGQVKGGQHIHGQKTLRSCGMITTHVLENGFWRAGLLADTWEGRELAQVTSCDKAKEFVATCKKSAAKRKHNKEVWSTEPGMQP